MKKKHIIVSRDKCVGCKICELFCSYEHYGDFNPRRSRIRVFSFHKTGLFVPLVCRKCDNAPCVSSCLYDAIQHLDDGTVTINSQKCIRCGVCAVICPFHAITIDLCTSEFIVCDFCDGDPICVKHCPSQALKIPKNVDENSKTVGG